MAKPTWNHRVVRRYNKQGEPYLVITEVHYRGERPRAFALDWSPMGYDEEAEGNGTHTDGAALDGLRWQVARMQAAMEQPILDENVDFEA